VHGCHAPSRAEMVLLSLNRMQSGLTRGMNVHMNRMAKWTVTEKLMWFSEDATMELIFLQSCATTGLRCVQLRSLLWSVLREHMHLALKVWVVCPSVCLSVCVSCRCLPQPERQRDSIVTPVTVPQILMERVDVVL